MLFFSYTLKCSQHKSEGNRMKKKVSFALGLFSVAGFMMSCTGKNINWENFKLENVSDYSAIGFAAFSPEKKHAKTKKNREKDKNEETNYIQACTLGSLISNEKISVGAPFTLAGQINNEIVELGFKNGNNQNNMQIDVFGNMGDFVFFRPLSSQSDSIREFNGSNVVLNENEYILYLPFVGSNFVPNYNNDNPGYFLSMKTGKIYKYEEGIHIINFKAGGGIIYFVGSGEGLRDDCVYEIVEENETLNFTPTKIPFSYFSEPFIDTKGKLEPDIDKYGNFLTTAGIITPDAKIHKFSSYFDGGNYAINGENEIVYFSSDHLTSYVLNSDGEFVKSEEALKGLYFERTGQRYNSDVHISKEDYLKEIAQTDLDGYAFITYDENDYVVVTDGTNFEKSEQYISKNQIIYQNDEYAYDPMMQRYLTDKRGFYIYDHMYPNNISSINETILRGDFVYYYRNGELRKFDMSTETDEALSFENNYALQSLGVDTYGRITVECLDDSFNRFVGYLEMDDTISLEAKEVPEVSNYVLYPVN